MEVGIVRSLSTPSASSPSTSTRTSSPPTASASPRPLPLHLREIEYLSRKFRDIVVEGEHHLYVPVYAVARGGTWQRLYFMDMEEYLVRTKTSSPAQSGSPVEPCSSSTEKPPVPPRPPRRRERLGGEALKKHNIYRQKSRRKDVLGKVSINVVPPGRRLHLTLTSQNPLPDAREKIDEIVRSAARKVKNKSIFAFWVAALQGRGVEHFHVQVYVPGIGDLPRNQKQEIEEYVEKRWKTYVNQHLPVQMKVTEPSDEQDCRKVESYIANQEVTSEDEDGASVTTPTATGTTKKRKPKSFGIINRRAYEECTEVEERVLPDHDLAYRIRRLLRNDVIADVRSWSERRRFRTQRFQIEGRFHRSEKVAFQALSHVMTSRYGPTHPTLQLLPPKK